MNLLVLGSEGFIGRNAVAHFRSLGYKVTQADIVLKEAPDYLLINPEAPDFGTIFLHRQFDVCINATGAANVQLSFSNPALDFSLNTANLYYLLDSMRMHSPGCKFINISSAAVYGNPTELPIKETAPLRPMSPYGFHKQYSEQICREFFVFFKLPTISIRVFSAYGEGLKKQLFWDLYKKVSQNDGLVQMYGTGSETRDFIYIKDLLHSMHCIILKADFNGGVVNVANGIESSIREVVDIFMELFPSKAQVQFIGNNKLGDPLNWKADISLLSSFGFSQNIH
jgi:dTDP-glucose 4,6-dehydratase/UDP-glucose 4-epimerase